MIVTCTGISLSMSSTLLSLPYQYPIPVLTIAVAVKWISHFMRNDFSFSIFVLDTGQRFVYCGVCVCVFLCRFSSVKMILWFRYSITKVLGGIFYFTGQKSDELVNYKDISYVRCPTKLMNRNRKNNYIRITTNLLFTTPVKALYYSFRSVIFSTIKTVHHSFGVKPSISISSVSAKN